jgi:beta-lactamase class D
VVTRGVKTVAVTLAAAVCLTGAVRSAEPVARHDCAIVQGPDGRRRIAGDAAECGVKTAPASTFKLPHSLIALETGVVTDPLALVPWDGTRQPFPAWERDHSLDSAVKASVLPFFRRTAAAIGRERMTDYLKRLRYGADTFEGELTSFWLNGDLVISPFEQIEFLTRLVRGDVPVAPRNLAAAKAAFRMPHGAITNATGTLDFQLMMPGPLEVHAKTGNATVRGESVSWIVGYVDAKPGTTVFAARVRATGDVSRTASLDLARDALSHR